MESSVQVANEALTLIGDQSITALTEDSDRARAVKRVYLPTLDAALRRHDWNFARLRASLGRLTATPDFDYDYMYQLPQDPLCLRVLNTNLLDDEAWEIESYITDSAQYRVLLTDETEVEIVYIARLEDPTLWDPLFADAFVYEVAKRIAYSLTRNATLVAELARDVEEKWKVARSVDGQEARKLKKMLGDTLTKDR